MNSTDDFRRLSFGGGGAADDIFAIFNLDEGKVEKYNEANRLLVVADEISSIYIWVLFAFGVPGNLLTIITMLTMQVVSPTIFFVAVLAGLDAASLIGKLTAHQLVRNHVYIGKIGCKFQFLTICSGTLSNWVLVLMCTERFISVCYKKKKRNVIFTNRNWYFAVFVLSVTFLAFFAGVSGAMRGVDDSGMRCGTYNEYLWFWMNIWFWINSSLYLFIPCLCVIPMLILVFRTLHLQRRSEFNQRSLEIGNRNETTAIDQPDLTHDDVINEEGGFTLMVFVATLLFLVLSLPSCVYYLSYQRNNDSLIEAKWALFEQIQFILVDSRHAINCLLYFFSAKRFRAQLVYLFLCKSFRSARLSFVNEELDMYSLV